MDKIKRTFLHDAINFVSLAAQSLENDDFSDCFHAASPYEMKGSGVLYVFSFIIRYFLLFPLRVISFSIGASVIGLYFLYGKYTHNYDAISNSFTLFNKLLMTVLNFKANHHGTKVKHSEPHVYVSNHTSFIDYILLSSYKFSHACIAEVHGGLFGFILLHILAHNGSIGFKRSDKQDRSQIIGKIKEHIHRNLAPMLIFPEGTCVNNRYVVLFQKGAFDLDTLVCPVAIKYQKDLMEPYWNRRMHGFTGHIFYLATRWRIDADVYWMDPVRRNEDETSVEFSHRVKNMIAEQLDIKNTLWNGSFKSSPVLNDREILKNCFVKVYCRIRNNLRNNLLQENKDESFIFSNANISQESKNDRMYFGCVSYKAFINECCKEYLREKNASISH